MFFGKILLKAKTSTVKTGPKGRLLSLGTSALLILTGILSCVPSLGVTGIGVFALIIILPMLAILEYPVPKIVTIAAIKTHVYDKFVVRAIIHFVCAIILFFSAPTVINGIGYLVVCFMYGWAHHKGEKPEDIKAPSAEQSSAPAAPAPAPAGSNTV